MSLMKLLTAGNSFGEAKDGPNSYALRQGYLPKFAPGRRSISLAPTIPEKEPIEAPVALTRAKIEQPVPNPFSQPPMGKPSLPGILRSFSAQKRRSKQERLVQIEWALTKVQVMRNDLSETDFIVRHKQPEVKAEARPESGWLQGFWQAFLRLLKPKTF